MNQKLNLILKFPTVHQLTMSAVMSVNVRYKNIDNIIEMKNSDPSIKDLNQKVLKNIIKSKSKNTQTLHYIFKGKNISNPKEKFSEHHIISGSKLLLHGIVSTQKITKPKTRTTKKIDRLSLSSYSDIIEKGPPEGCIPGSKGQMQTMPKEPLIVYDELGKITTLQLEQDDALYINPLNQSPERIFFHQISQIRIEGIPGYEDQYIALMILAVQPDIGFRIFFFIPKQYSKLFDGINDHKSDSINSEKLGETVMKPYSIDN